MVDRIMELEQSNVDETIRLVNENESDVIKEYEFCGLHFYNSKHQYSTEEQEKIQDRFYQLKPRIDRTTEIIQAPYFGRISYLNFDGEFNTCYIGQKPYYLNGETLIFDWRSAEGGAFRSRWNTYHDMNVIINRTLEINHSKLLHYYDFINREYRSSFEKATAPHGFGDFIEINKAKKDILPSLDIIQNTVVDQAKDRNLIIHGVPGSGKTALGGYRLSLMAFLDQQTLEVSNTPKYIYVSPSDRLKLYSRSFFSKIDVSQIQFLGFSDMLKFTRIENDTNPSTKQVFIKSLEVKAKLLSRDEFDKGKECHVELPDKEIAQFKRSDLILYHNAYTRLGREIFGTGNIDQRIKKFENHIKTQDEFDILNDPQFIDVLKIERSMSRKEFLNTFSMFVRVVNQRYHCNLDSSSSRYLFIFYYLLQITDSREKEIKDARNPNMSMVVRNPLMIPRVVESNNRYVRHIYLDEAQDYTLSELILIRNLYPNATFTLCGDVNQSSGYYPSQNDWGSLQIFLEADLLELNTCYRSSRKIIEYFNKNMSSEQYGLAKTYEENSDGIVKRYDSIDDFLRNESSRIQNVEVCFVYLNPTTKDYLVSMKLDPNFKIIYGFDVKGMEFDTVILCDVDSIINNVYGLKFRYMLISRAIHNLYLIAPSKNS